jgi:hypothetical protein
MIQANPGISISRRGFLTKEGITVAEVAVQVNRQA